MFASVIKVDLIKDHKVEINYGPDKSVKHRPDKMARFEGVLGLLVRESSDDPSEIRIVFLSFYACASRLRLGRNVTFRSSLPFDVFVILYKDDVLTFAWCLANESASWF